MMQVTIPELYSEEDSFSIIKEERRVAYRD